MIETMRSSITLLYTIQEFFYAIPGDSKLAFGATDRNRTKEVSLNNFSYVYHNLRLLKIYDIIILAKRSFAS